jgi:hypothetical protein
MKKTKPCSQRCFGALNNTSKIDQEQHITRWSRNMRGHVWLVTATDTSILDLCVSLQKKRDGLPLRMSASKVVKEK